MIQFCETERFILRELIPEDADALFELDSNPEVHRYLGNQAVERKEQSREVIEHVMHNWYILQRTMWKNI